MATLTREQMEQVINGGGSVLVGGRLITRVQDLPSPAQLAAGNPEQEQATLADLQAQIRRLEQERDGLAAKSTKKEPK